MNAWLLTWEGTVGKHLWDNDNQIVTILRARMSFSDVEQMVYVLYTRCLWTASDLSYFANRRKKREKLYKPKYTNDGRGFSYGNNPWIYARRVTDLIIEIDEENRIEHISWNEPQELIFDSNNQPIGFEPAVSKELTRTLVPISAEVYPRRV